MSKRKIAAIISRYYFVYAIIALVVAGPVFTLITNYVYRLNVKTILRDTKERFCKEMVPSLTIADVEVWNRTHWDMKILDDSTTAETSIVLKTYQTKEHSDDLKLELSAPLVIEGKKYTFWTVQDIVEPRAFYFNTLLMFGGLALFLFGGLFVITRKLSGDIGRKFHGVLTQIGNFDLKEETLPDFPQDGIEELVDLCTMLKSRMIINLKIHEAQQEFVENAAHEIQTPVAIFQAKLDVLMQDESLNRTQWKTLNALNKNIARMSRLNKNLLLLSKIDHDSYSSVEQVNINKILDDQMDFIEDQLMQKQLTLHLETEDVIEVKGNVILLEVLVSNLIMNSIRHNVYQGAIFVTTQAPNTFIVSNTGDEPLLEEKLFNRFYKKDASDSVGTGLGLSIVQKIVLKNHWSINYYFENNRHYFKVTTS